MDEKRGFLKDLPIQNKDSFKIYHEGNGNTRGSRQSQFAYTQHRSSIYPTTPDTVQELRIVNETKPQVTLNYLRVRGGQINSQSQSDKPAKRKKTMRVKA